MSAPTMSEKNQISDVRKNQKKKCLFDVDRSAFFRFIVKKKDYVG